MKITYANKSFFNFTNKYSLNIKIKPTLYLSSGIIINILIIIGFYVVLKPHFSNDYYNSRFYNRSDCCSNMRFINFKIKLYEFEILKKPLTDEVDPISLMINQELLVDKKAIDKTIHCPMDDKEYYRLFDKSHNNKYVFEIFCPIHGFLSSPTTNVPHRTYHTKIDGIENKFINLCNEFGINHNDFKINFSYENAYGDYINKFLYPYYFKNITEDIGLTSLLTILILLFLKLRQQIKYLVYKNTIEYEKNSLNSYYIVHLMTFANIIILLIDLYIIPTYSPIL